VSGDAYRWFGFPPEQFADFLNASHMAGISSATFAIKFHCERLARLKAVSTS
jgi:hypothetical protein